MEFHDLSVAVDEDTTVSPGLPNFRQGSVYDRDETGGYESDYMTTSLHVGTHVDAPSHFDPDGDPIGAFDLSELVRPTVKADVRDVSEPNAEISLETIRSALPAPVEENGYLFIHTGWADDRFGDPTYSTENPYYESAAMEFVAESGARGLVTDTPVDSRDGGSPNHETLCQNDVLIVENVVNVAGLPDEFTTWVTPMKLARGEAGPARVFVVKE